MRDGTGEAIVAAEVEVDEVRERLESQGVQPPCNAGAAKGNSSDDLHRGGCVSSSVQPGVAAGDAGPVARVHAVVSPCIQLVLGVGGVLDG